MVALENRFRVFNIRTNFHKGPAPAGSWSPDPGARLRDATPDTGNNSSFRRDEHFADLKKNCHFFEFHVLPWSSSYQMEDLQVLKTSIN